MAPRFLHIVAILFLLSSCGHRDSDSAPSPTPSATRSPERGPERSRSRAQDGPQSRQSVTPFTTQEPNCLNVVQDPDAPLHVRVAPSVRSRKVAELESGTVVEIAERKDGWVRIQTPTAGWVFERLIVDNCSVPVIWPGIGIGSHIYALFAREEQNVAPVPEHAEFIGQVVRYDPEPMAFYGVAVEGPRPPMLTAVLETEGVNCRGRASRVLKLWTVCDLEGGDAIQVTSYSAFEFDCSDAPPEVLVVSSMESAQVELNGPWASSQTRLTAAQQHAIGEVKTEPHGHRFHHSGSNVIMVHETEDLGAFMFLDDRLAHYFRGPAESERTIQLRAGNFTFAVLPIGFHELGRFVLPTTREVPPSSIWFPALSCGSF